VAPRLASKRLHASNLAMARVKPELRISEDHLDLD